jgi:hypothetical protein
VTRTSPVPLVPADVPRVPSVVTLNGRDGTPHRFTGYALGLATSRADQHTHREPYAAPGTKCSACRWFAVGIYRVFDAFVLTDGDVPVRRPTPRGYVVQTVGESVVPGEQRLARVEETSSAYEVVELLTVRRRGAEPFITPQSLRALARAAQLDDDVRDAYVNRAVV